jgi:hypothetical protein
VLRKIFGPKREEVILDWRKLRAEELNGLYSYPNILPVIKLRRMRWAGHVARMGEMRGAHKVLVWKPDCKGSLERPRRRWKDDANMDHKGLCRESVGCILVSQKRGRLCL